MLGRDMLGWWGRVEIVIEETSVRGGGVWL